MASPSEALVGCQKSDRAELARLLTEFARCDTAALELRAETIAAELAKLRRLS